MAALVHVAVMDKLGWVHACETGTGVFAGVGFSAALVGFFFFLLGWIEFKFCSFSISIVLTFVSIDRN